jgi:hypothetical protein
MHRSHLLIASTLLVLGAHSVPAQDVQPLVPSLPSRAPSVTDSTPVWLTHRDRVSAAGFLSATLLALPFDRAAAHWIQQPALHRNARVAGAAAGIREQRIRRLTRRTARICCALSESQTRIVREIRSPPPRASNISR